MCWRRSPVPTPLRRCLPIAPLNSPAGPASPTRSPKIPTRPIEVLRPVVRYLSVSAVQELFEDLDRLSTSPALVAALVASAVITAEQRNQLLDLQREEPGACRKAFAE